MIVDNFCEYFFEKMLDKFLDSLPAGESDVPTEVTEISAEVAQAEEGLVRDDRSDDVGTEYTLPPSDTEDSGVRAGQGSPCSVDQDASTVVDTEESSDDDIPMTMDNVVISESRSLAACMDLRDVIEFSRRQVSYF